MEVSKRASPRLDRQTIVRLKYKGPGAPKTRGTIYKVFFSLFLNSKIHSNDCLAISAPFSWLSCQVCPPRTGHMLELLLTNNQFGPHKIPVKSTESLWNYTWLGQMVRNYWSPLLPLEQQLSSLREAASQSKPIAMMCSIRPIRPVCLYFCNACHSCWNFRPSCLSNHLSEWKMWEVNKPPSRHLATRVWSVPQPK